MTGSRSRTAILAALLFSAATRGAEQEPPRATDPAAAQAPAREVFDYSVEWRLVPAGTAKLIWTAMPHSAVAASELRFHIESAGLVSRLFRVSDDYTALMGSNFCAQSTFLAAHEGSRNRETRVNYDSSTRKASYIEKDLAKNATTTHEAETTACVHDVLGGLMVLRNLRLEPGKTVQIPVSDGKKFAQIKIESQRREDLKTISGGVQKTIMYEAFVFDNVFYKRSGHLHIWLTDDNRRIPVQLQAHLQFTIGTITFRLEKEEKL